MMILQTIIFKINILEITTHKETILGTITVKIIVLEITAIEITIL
jgi:hypothetical protein